MPYLIKENAKNEIYKNYVATAVGHLAGMQKQYYDLVDFDRKPKDTRTADEIVMDTIAGAGLVVIE